MKYFWFKIAITSLGLLPELAHAKHKKKHKSSASVAEVLPAHTKARGDDLKKGDLVLVSNMYRPQYGCGGHIEKVLTKGSQRWYLVNIKSCDGKSFTTLTQLDREELMLIK